MFLKQLRKYLFGMSLEEGSVERRGFEGGERQVREHLSRVGYVFLRGYNTALLNGVDGLGERLGRIPLEMQGFAFEGAAMALALLDYFTPWKRYRVRSFLAGAGANHPYMIHVGIGWALARLPAGRSANGRIGEWARRRLYRPLAPSPPRPLAHSPPRPLAPSLMGFDPLLGWLAIDGYGFHEGYFHAPRYFEKKAQPRLSAYGKRVFDQGLGRSLWFVKVADVGRIVTKINEFAPSRQADLWSGVGLACAYAGGIERAGYERLRSAAGSYAPQLAQGVAFAAKTRQRAGNLVPHTELACEVLCGRSAHRAAEVTDITLSNLPSNGAEPAYEVWRQRIQAHFTKETVFS